MHKIPPEILNFFVRHASSAEEVLLNWLVENKIEKLDCSLLVIPSRDGQTLGILPSQIIRIAKAIAKSSVHTVDFSRNMLDVNGLAVASNLTEPHSKVHTVDFSRNGFGEYGPQVATNLTREHSKVHTVDFRYNCFGTYGPSVAANLTGEHSKVGVVNFRGNNFAEFGPEVASNLTGQDSRVYMVDFSKNGCDENDLKMVKNLTGRYSKIIGIKGVKLTEEQLNENKVNFIMKFLDLSRNSLKGLTFKAYYKALRKDVSDELLPRHIAQLLSQGQTEGIMALITALLFHQNILKIDDIIKNNTDEIVKSYVEKNYPEMKPISQLTETFCALTFSEKRVSGQEFVKVEEQEKAKISERTASVTNKYK